MKKEIELALASELLKPRPAFPRTWIRDNAERLGFVEKQAIRTLEKWSDSDLYEYGVCVDLGWLTPRGVEYFERSNA